MMDERRFWIGFDRIRGIGSVRTKKLLDYFGNLSEAWKASPGALQEAGLPIKIVREFVSIRKQIDLEAEWERLRELGMEVITYNQENYPRLLQSINHPPPVLYVKGDLKIYI